MDSYMGNSQDPISLHKYLYANANPLTYTDPTGHYSIAQLSNNIAVRGILAGVQYGGYLQSIRDIVNGNVQFSAVSIIQEIIFNQIRISKAFITIAERLKWLKKSPWVKNPFERGRIIEEQLLAKLGIRGMKSPNFPVIDSITGGIARSIKSLDVHAKSYQNIATLKRTLKGYVDKVSKFKGRKWGGDVVELQNIKGRALDVAVPKGMNTDQQQIFIDIIEYAKEKGVEFTLHTM
jgi:hypothetical protein